MATQLTRRRILSSFSDDAPVLNVPVRYMIAIAAACVAFAYTSLFAGLYNAHRDESHAERRYADTLTLIEAPAPHLEAMMAGRDAAQAALAGAQAAMQPAAVDPSSDEATTLLVTQAQASGLTVTGVTRVDPSQAKTESATYDVQAIRITATGTFAQVDDFLATMHAADPGLIATIAAISVDATGTAKAEIAFSVHTPAVESTPAAGATR